MIIHRVILVTSLAALLAVSSLPAQDHYLNPPDAIARILDQPLTPVANLSPDRQWLVLLARPSLPPISEVAAPDLRLAGVRIDPVTNGSSRAPSFTGYLLRAVNGDVERAVQAPAGARLGPVDWAPGGERFAFTITTDEGIALWVAETATGAARALSGAELNGVVGAPCRWLPDGTGLICRTVAAGRGQPPRRATIPTGPITQESEGRAAPNRTYQDLLQSPTDEALFDYYFTSQIVRINLDGSRSTLGRPAVHTRAEPSPDGQHLLVQTLHRPYSYLVPLFRFPTTTDVWNLEGSVVARVADVGLQEEVPASFDAVTSGPRGVTWRADAPATLLWAEAVDGGDPRQQVAVRDEVRLLAAPFAGPPTVLARLALRHAGTQWGPGGMGLVSERWNRTSQTRTWMIRPGAAPKAIFELSSEDRYADPGSFLTTTTPGGTRVLQTTPDGRFAFLEGSGASDGGDRPFLDRYELATGRTVRLWRSAAPYYEEPVALVDPARQVVITIRESVDDPPNYFLRDLSRNRSTQLTRFTDPAPDFAGVTKELITYPRADGVQLSATVYLPKGYQKGQGPIPFFFWAYPREFRSADAAAQVIGSPYRFTRPSGSSHLFLLLAGYGVLDNPTMPIVAVDGAEPNDTYVKQLVSSAKAAVDKVAEMGVADRNRVGIGGHSYGAFMTANLLAHSDLFQAGIARSGAYNRTLTPFGFQAEERTYWQAQEIYSTMSPFTYANQINEPMLMVHGQDDDNSGTFPIQSERMYSAIKGNGGKVRLVWLPGEAHGYRARESVGHTLREMVDWMARYVKDAGRRAATP